MKKVKFTQFCLVALAAIMFLGSCTNDEDQIPVSSKKANLTIKIAGAAKSRAVESPGQEITATLTEGLIFIISSSNAVIDRIEMDKDAATSPAGQLLANPVPVDARVYIVGNYTATEKTALAACTSLNAINAVQGDIAEQTSYTGAALANVGSTAQAITVLGEDATVTVQLQPVISRLELAQVKSKPDITSFTVAGVYVDSYHSHFTYGGSYAGTTFAQGTETIFTGKGDSGLWESIAGNAGDVDGNVWAHQVASGGVVPRFIIHIKDIVAPGIDSTRDYYLTVKSYTGVTEFERGKIYRIGGTKGIEFGIEDLGTTPNPENVNLTVNVEVLPWVVVTPDAEI